LPNPVPAAARWLHRFAPHVPTILVGFGVLATNSVLMAVLWFAASRLAYVLYVGLSLSAERRRKALSHAVGAEEAWRRFRDRSSWLMDNDAVAFCALCVATSFTLRLGVPLWATIAIGAGLVLVGLGVKIWAAQSLEPGSYHWRNFFVPPSTEGLSEKGPYRWLANPMYTIGYAHAYGLALAVRSPWGLAAAAFAQASILLLNFLVEGPHVRTLEDEMTSQESPVRASRVASEDVKGLRNPGGRVEDESGQS
jgi:protein-S-isoprenylcysteine O-methyltransferase Ste14